MIMFETKIGKIMAQTGGQQ